MSELFYTNPESIGSLLSLIEEGKIVLPGFQRRFEWDTARQQALIRTILNSYPAGSLLFLQYPKAAKLGRRLIDGVDSSKENSHPERIMLDGQQRLTTLYHVCFGTLGAYSLRGFISINDANEFFNNDGKLPDSNEKSGIELVKKSVKFMLPSIAQAYYNILENQFESHMIPLTCVFEKEKIVLEGGEKEIGFDEWKALYVEHHEPDDKGRRLALNKKLEEVKRRFISPIKDYRFPVVVLQEKTEPHAVCQVFVDLNIQQKPLSSFEVAAAKVWPFEIDLYGEWDKAQGISTISDFLIDPVLPLKTITLLQTNEDPDQKISCSKRALYQLKPDGFKESWTKAIDAMDWLIRLLKAECGVLHRKWLPYSSLLVSMAATLISAEEAGFQREQEEVKRKLMCWYWCSVFAETYSGGTDSQNARDFWELQLWMHNKDVPYTVKYFSSMFNPEILRNTCSGGRYRGAVCLLLRNHARDFKTAQAISTSLILDENIDDHHVFPDKYLEKVMDESDWTKRNCILNRALVDELTNQTIGINPPSKYLGDIRLKIGVDSLKDVLESQFLPSDPSSALSNDNYDEFLNERQNILAKEIGKLTIYP